MRRAVQAGAMGYIGKTLKISKFLKFSKTANDPKGEAAGDQGTFQHVPNSEVTPGMVWKAWSVH